MPDSPITMAFCYCNRMFRLAVFVGLMAGLASTMAGTEPASTDKVPSHRDFGKIRRQVETLRGKTFLQSVPVYRISQKELRAISDRELEKDFPGPKLERYAELLAWLDVVPPGTDLKAVYADFLVDQLAGLYDSDTKEMCIPASAGGTTNSGIKAAEKKMESVGSELEDIVLAHEFTHALEDQHWPLDDPKDHDRTTSTDRSTAHQYLNEGSATCLMIEALPAQLGKKSTEGYFLLWNLLHSRLGERLLDYELRQVWKDPDALVPGVPDTLARTEAMPYSFGYSFCTRIMRDWGLDGLDYIYSHPPLSSAQVMHPTKSWEWRDFPVRISLPDALPGGWKQVSADCVGEAGLAVLLGCQFDGLNHALGLARGWDGDHVAMFESPGNHRLLLWASAWDSTNAAGRFVGTWLKERQVAHQAAITASGFGRIEWQSPDGGVGFIQRDGRRVVILETDDRKTAPDIDTCARAVTFVEPPEDAARAAANPPLRRFNPFWSAQKDGDYAIKRSLGGLLSRHDRNSVGAADRWLLGLLAESRRTTSFHKWAFGGGLIAKYESEARRGSTHTTWLPWGVLASHSAARLPQSPDITIARTSVLWGLGASVTADETGDRTVRVLPFGLLVHRTIGAGRSSFQILGTGAVHQEATDHSGSTTRYRLLGIPLWTTHSSPPD
jgi:hypothetical protein